MGTDFSASLVAGVRLARSYFFDRGAPAKICRRHGIQPGKPYCSQCGYCLDDGFAEHPSAALRKLAASVNKRPIEAWDQLWCGGSSLDLYTLEPGLVRDVNVFVLGHQIAATGFQRLPWAHVLPSDIKRELKSVRIILRESFFLDAIPSVFLIGNVSS